MNSLKNMDAAEKIVYLEVLAYNEKWCTRFIRGFGDETVKAKLTAMFEDRYPAKAKDSMEFQLPRLRLSYVWTSLKN